MRLRADVRFDENENHEFFATVVTLLTEVIPVEDAML